MAVDVVSVQSQVVYGRVGNNVALPTLDALGFNAAAVPTVLLSNTPHYASMHGGAVPAEWFGGWLDDLAARGALDSLQAVLTGYLGGAGQARMLARWIEQRLHARSGLCVMIDPVIGDHDHGVYVDPALIDAYQKELLPLADGLTPNAFELARLVDREVVDVVDTVRAARGLLTGRTRWVAVTSAAPQACATGCMQVVVVTRADAYLITHPRVDGEPKGTGDLFAASLLANLLHGKPLQAAAADACRRVLHALELTHAARCAELLLPTADTGMEATDGIQVANVSLARIEAGV